MCDWLLVSQGKRSSGALVPRGWLARRALASKRARMADLALSLTMLAALALLGGAVVLWRRGDKRKALLMATAALVALANVAIWSLPAPAPTGQRA